MGRGLGRRQSADASASSASSRAASASSLACSGASGSSCLNRGGCSIFLRRRVPSPQSWTEPLPVLGLRGRWHVAGNLYAQAHAQYFQLAFDGYDGNIQDYEAALIWQVKRHVGLGAAYNAFVTKSGADRDHFEGQLRWRYSGAQLFMRMSF